MHPLILRDMVLLLASVFDWYEHRIHSLAEARSVATTQQCRTHLEYPVIASLRQYLHWL